MEACFHLNESAIVTVLLVIVIQCDNVALCLNIVALCTAIGAL